MNEASQERDVCDTPRKREHDSIHLSDSIIEQELPTSVFNDNIDKSQTEDEDKEDKQMQCCICSENWVRKGVHRLVSLRCGHLFGESCIVNWLKTKTNFSANASAPCPLCTKPTKKGDIRPVRHIKIAALDMTEITKLRGELNAAETKFIAQQRTLDNMRLALNMHKRELTRVSEEHDMLKARLATSEAPSPAVIVEETMKAFKNVSSVQLSEQRNVARVMAINPYNETLFVSLKNMAHGHGVQKVSLQDIHNNANVTMHKSLVRDIKCSSIDKDLVLSTSLDKTLKLSSANNRCTVQEYSLEAAGWSCAFDNINPNLLYCGLANNTVMVYDIRNTSSHLHQLHIEKITSKVPLHSLAVTSTDNKTTILCADITHSHIWTMQGAEVHHSLLSVEENDYKPFSLSHDSTSSSVMISLRNATSTKHIIGMVDNASWKTSWSFESAHPQKAMTRTCHFMLNQKGIACFADEETCSVILRDQTNVIQNIPIGQPPVDIKHCRVGNSTILAVLTDNQLHLHKYL